MGLRPASRLGQVLASGRACLRGRGVGGAIAVAVATHDPARRPPPRPGGRRPRPGRHSPGGLYGVDVPAMSFQLHEWDIHIVRRGAGDASGAGGAGVDDPPDQAGNLRQ
jgi:hypothetical protein